MVATSATHNAAAPVRSHPATTLGWRSISAGALILMLMPGCAVLPNDQPLQHPVDTAAVGLGNAPTPVIRNDWWKAYGDQQFDDLARQALVGNPTLAQAVARVRQAQALSDSTHAALRPSVSFDAQDQRQRLSSNYIYPPPFGGGVYWIGQEGLNLSWDLDLWGRQASLLKQTNLRAIATELDVSSAQLALAGALSQAYFELDRQYALADLARRTEQQRRLILAITRSRVAAGLDTNVELRQAESAVPDAQVEIRQAEAAQQLAVHQIVALCGRGADAYSDVRRPRLDLDSVLPLPGALPADLLGRRPDVLAAKAQVEGAEAGQIAAKAAFYPDVSLSAFIGTDAVSVSQLFRASSGAYGIGPALHLPVFEGGRLRANYRGATADIDAAIDNYNGIVVQAVAQAADQLSLVDALQEEVAEQQQSLDAAEQAYQLAEERYQAGLSGYLTVLTAETQVLSARRQHIELGTAGAIARINLLLAIGGSFDPADARAALAAR